jgi:dienelactone hydrolase
MVWGNGGCLNVGTIMAPFLLQVASQGIVVLANGPPQNGGTGDFASFGTVGQAPKGAMGKAIEWAEQNKGKGKWAHLDTSRIAAAGQSCGGGEAYSAANNPKVTQIGIFNSGGMGGSVKGFTKPTFYFLGGPSDMAYNNVST